MSDEGMDPCECIWSHELSMRRLLSLLRRTQAYCTDTECTDMPLSPNNNQDPSGFMMMTLFVVFVLFMYYMRPRNQRLADAPTKPNNSGDPSGSPPPPPTLS